MVNKMLKKSQQAWLLGFFFSFWPFGYFICLLCFLFFSFYGGMKGVLAVTFVDIDIVVIGGGVFNLRRLAEVE